MRNFISGAAAIALMATFAHAQPGKEKGGDQGRPAVAAKQDGGKDKSRRGADRGDRGGPKHAERGPRRESKERRAERRQERRESARENRAERRDLEKDRREQRAERREDRTERREDRSDRRDAVVGRRDVRRDNRVDRREARFIERGERFGLTPLRESRRLVEGCPPGLAKKNNGCMPPGLAKKRGDNRGSYYRPDYFGYGRLGDGRYFYEDGFLLRLDARDRVSGYIPLLGGALAIGNVWPTYYERAALPDYYVDYFNLGGQQSYRYADDVIYRVDPETAAITSIAALLTGDDFRIGQPMPRGYDVYNVPYAYRDRYYDRDDAMYRYSDGYVYQIDPETMLVASAIQLLI